METLFQFLEGEYKMVLAESYEWVEPTLLEVKIRDDVYFHTGDKMTIDDVIFSNNLSKE